MDSWMKKLAHHYERTRELYPEEKLIILFDIDGTILDMRVAILYVLQSFDRCYKTNFFKHVKLWQVNAHETEVERLLDELCVPMEWRHRIIKWYAEQFWSHEAIMEAHRPFEGVMEVIRWFQIQPNTYVGLNTGRPESIRSDTLCSLNKIGQEYKVYFRSDLLFMMKTDGTSEDVVNSKVAGILHFQKAGYHIFAFVDNEPENLRAVAEVDPQKQILLLHANTIFKSKRRRLPPNTVAGKRYDFTDLIHEKNLPKHVQFVWHGVNDEGSIQQFLASNIQWAECDVRMDPEKECVVLRDDSFDSVPLRENEQLVTLHSVLVSFKESGKSIKLDLKEGSPLIEQVLEILRQFSIRGENVWFNGQIEVLKESGFRKLATAYPSAVIQCPIDSLIPLILSVPGKALALLDMFNSWGINRFSISWKNVHCKEILNTLEKWGFETNIYNVPNLTSFLRAVLLLPTSVSSDFNFPKWQYYEKGSVTDRRLREYPSSNAFEYLSLIR